MSLTFVGLLIVYQPKTTLPKCCILKSLWLCVYSFSTTSHILSGTQQGPGKCSPPARAHYAWLGPQDIPLWGIAFYHLYLQSAAIILSWHFPCSFDFSCFWQPTDILVWDYQYSSFKEKIFISVSGFAVYLKIISKRTWRRLILPLKKKKRITILCKDLFQYYLKIYINAPPKIVENFKIPNYVCFILHNESASILFALEFFLMIFRCYWMIPS